MSQRQHDQAGFITWADAMQLLREIERETNTTISLHLQLATLSGGGFYFTGSLRAERWIKNGKDDNPPWVGFTFPHRDHRTITGALVARAHALHEHIVRQEKHEEEQLAQAGLFPGE